MRRRHHFGGLYLIPGAHYGAAGTTDGGRAPLDFHFATAGNDTTGTGTDTEPYKTIVKALSLDLQSGDRLLFKGGDTFSSATLAVPVNGLTIGSYGTGKATISRAGGEAITLSGNANVVITNLNLRSSTDIALRSNSSSASVNITVQNCDISSTGGGGMQTGALDAHWLIKDNVIHDSADHGLVLQGALHEVSGNTFDSNADGVSGGHDLYIHASGVSWDQAVLIHDNIFTSLAPGSAISPRRGFTRIYSNHITILDGGSGGISYFDESTVAGGKIWLYNNLIEDVPAGGAGIYIGAANPDAGGTVTMTDFVIVNNSVIGDGADALYDFSAEATVVDDAFPSNIVFRNNGAAGTFTNALVMFPFVEGKVFDADFNGWWADAGNILAHDYFKYNKDEMSYAEWALLDVNADNNDNNRTSDPDITSGFPANTSDWADGGTATVDSDLTYATSGTSAALIYAGTAPDIGAVSTDQVYVLTPPINLTAGALAPTGARNIGTVITATRGVWVRVPTAYKYEWLKDGTTVVQDSGFISASTNNYTLQTTDAGHEITCRVTSQNAAGNSSPTTGTGSVTVNAPATALSVVQRVVPTSPTTASTHPARTISAPTVGNVMYAIVAVNSATDSTVTAVELGSSGTGKTFTEITPAGGINNAANVRLSFWRRVLVTGDNALTTVTATQSVSRNWEMSVYELTGVDTTTPEDLVGTGATGTSSSNANTGALSGTTASGALLLGANASRNGHVATEDATNETPGTGWTVNAAPSSATAGGAQLALAVFDQLLVGTATSPKAAAKLATTGGSATSDAWAGFIISVKPEGSDDGGGDDGGGGTDPVDFLPGPPAFWGNLSTALTNPGWRPDLTTFDPDNPFSPPQLYYDNATAAVISGGEPRSTLRGTAVDTGGNKYTYYPRSLGADLSAIDFTDPAHLKVTVVTSEAGFVPDINNGDTIQINDATGIVFLPGGGNKGQNLKPKIDGNYTVTAKTGSGSGSVLTLNRGWTPNGVYGHPDDPTAVPPDVGNSGELDARVGHRGYVTKHLLHDDYHEVIVTESTIATAADSVGAYFTADGDIDGANTAGPDGYWVWTGGHTNNWSITGNSPGSLKIRIPGNLDVINGSAEYTSNGAAADSQIINPFNACIWTNVTVDINGMSCRSTAGGVLAYSQELDGLYFPQGESISYNGVSGVFKGVANLDFIYDANKIGGASANLRWEACANYRMASAGTGGHTDCYQIFYLDNSALPPDVATWTWCTMMNGGNGQIFLNEKGGGSGTKFIINVWALYCLSWRGNKFLDLASSQDVGARHCWINDDTRGDGTLAAVSPRPEPLDLGNGPPAHPYPRGIVIWPTSDDIMANIAVANDGTTSTAPSPNHLARPTKPDGAVFDYSN